MTVNSLLLTLKDQTYKYFQNPNFWWCTGVDQPECYALISVDTGEVHMFTEKKAEVYKYWMKILELEEYHQLYEIDTMKFNEDLEQSVEELDPSLIYILGEGTNPYSGRGPLCPEFDWFSKYNINNASLFHIINECRLFKTKDEIDLMKNAAKVGCDAHIFIMKNIKPGMTETHIQTLFRVLNFLIYF